MVDRLGLTGPQMREIEMYGCIEPIGEGMVDYSGESTPAKQPALDVELKARLKTLAKRQRHELKRQKKRT